MKEMSSTALIMIGFQNDYFSPQGILHCVIEKSSRITGVLENTINLLHNSGKDFGLVINTPIYFTDDYRELGEPLGILKTIKDVGAFKIGSYGAEVIDDLAPFDHFVKIIPGKRGLNAFSNTVLEETLKMANITDIVLVGTVTSICIDSTARSAVERGFNVTILSDCTSSRTPFEQDFFCEEVFPLYAKVHTSKDLLYQLA